VDDAQVWLFYLNVGWASPSRNAVDREIAFVFRLPARKVPPFELPTSAAEPFSETVLLTVGLAKSLLKKM